MLHFYTPAIKLMNRLKYGRKFALITLLFLFPLITVITLLLNATSPLINFDRAKLNGIAYLRPIRQMLEDVSKERIRASTNSGQDRLSDQSKIELDFQAIALKQAQLGEQLQTSEQFAQLQQDWQHLKAAAQTLDSVSSEQLHQALITDLRSLVRQTGDTSNLILDPALESYYLMDTILLKLPERADLLAETKVLGTTVATNKTMTADQKARLTQLIGLLRANVAEGTQGIQVAFRSDPTLQLALLDSLQTSSGATQALADLIEHELLQSANIQIDPGIYSSLAIDAIEHSFRHWDLTVVELDRILQQRVDRYIRQQRLAELISLLMLAFVIYLLTAFYVSVRRTVATLDQAAQRMVGGDTCDLVAINNRDELGQVVRSFNSIATKLRLELEQAQEERARARAAEEKYRTIFENSVEGIFQTTPDGRYLSANPAMARMYGYASPEDMKNDVIDIAEQLYVQPGRRDLFRHLITEQGSVRNFESQFYSRSGEIFWISENAHAVRDANGQILYYEGTVEDITERKRAQEEISLLAHAVRSIRECVSITDMNDRLFFVNEAFLHTYGFTEAEISGQSIEVIRSPNNPIELVNEILPATLRGGWQGELLNRRKDGSEFPIFLSTSMIYDDQGQPFALIGVANDITERRHAEEELRRAKDAAEMASRSKSTFLANMSHELRTPLNAIIGYSEMLQEEAEDLDQPDLIPDLQKIQGAGKHLLGLINDILDLSKIEAGRMELYLETFDINAMLQEVATTVHPLILKQNNTLALNIAPDLGNMHADVTKIRQALFNLLSNANKFTQNGSISLDVLRTPAHEQPATVISPATIVFRVRDSGIGMTLEQIGQLFQPFTQADASTTRKYGGTGLGLTITRKFCQMMGGDIAVTSSLGQGSTFSLYIPIRVVDPKAEPAPTREPSSMYPQNERKTILVIDDDPTSLELISRFLSKEGFHIESALNGEQGLLSASKLHPDAIILDVMMPGMDGWSVLTALKADPALHDIPVIMLTIVDDKNMGFALGAADYLTKPIERDRLMSILHKYQYNPNNGPVLIVEDDASTRQMLQRTLEKEDWRVIEAENGHTALKRLAEHRPQIILLDLMMPAMDGFELVDMLQQHEQWSTIPIIVITAKDITIEDRQRLHGGVRKILQKGNYSRTELLQEVRALVKACIPAQ